MGKPSSASGQSAPERLNDWNKNVYVDQWPTHARETDVSLSNTLPHCFVFDFN